jgi:PTH1 family peptidyl-tRNA hydrolase
VNRRLVCGLGNPGKKYLQTRHNVGFMVIDSFFRECGGAGFTRQWDSEVAMLEYKGVEVCLQKPQTFVNLSGIAVANALKALSLSPEDLLVIHDDFALPFGKVRVSFDASDGGHKGVRSVIAELGTKGFSRVRVGIGLENGTSQALEAFVLSPFSAKEQGNLHRVVEGAVLAMGIWLLEGVRCAQDAINGKVFLDRPSCPPQKGGTDGRKEVG